MNVLVVENKAGVIATLLDGLKVRPEILVEVAMSRDVALRLIGAKRDEFDLAVFDLQIPTTDGALDEDVSRGLHVFSRLGELSRGTPRIVWSGKATIPAMDHILSEQFRADPFGRNIEQAMVEFLDKDDLRRCVDRILALSDEIAELQRIAWSWGVERPDVLDPMERVVDVFARRHGAAIVRVERLGGGMTDAKTLRLDLRAADGSLASLVVAKIGHLQEVKRELDAYHALVAPTLPPATYTPYVDRVMAGANGRGGAFYSLAAAYDRSLFDVLRQNVGEAASVVDRLRQATANWRVAAPQERSSISDIREMLVPDAATMARVAPGPSLA